ncbi:uncharacterized protein GIQ15_02768 [Arthroderma uncinatum]|uniref:uncharacterized protein n=1 Tax=Arthroderma uncinatum TaxID=74035 RepID=UPI00144AC7E0|nr:uncharacterized protein GIQ15_02768 [Arthroderma uncinatum]KAF3483444.1 hypothetical protein GIQ15_02768 [Arthroderma uncinatum]
MATETLSRPSQFQLALALAVVKSKPSDTSIREHILKLRNYISTGKRTYVETSGQENHLDSTAFWREAYEKSEAAQSKLLDKIYELEQRNEARVLREGWDNPFEVALPGQSKAPTDPKRPTSSRPNKRAKTMSVESQTCTQPFSRNWLQHNLEAFQFCGGSTTHLMRNFHTLQTLLRKKTNPEAIADVIVSICRMLETALLSAVQDETAQKYPAKRGKEPIQSPLQQLSIILARIYPTILQGLTRTSSIREARASAGLMVYHITVLFQQMMQQSYQYALAKADPGSSDEKPPAKSRQKPKAKTTRQKKKPSDKPPPGTENTLACFARIASIMFISLDPGKPEHKGVLEGLTFVILEHIGKLLGIITFRDLSSNAELSTVNPMLPLPACLTATNNSLRAPIPELAEIAALWNSKHLLWLLEKAVLYMDKHQESFEQTSISANGALPLNLLAGARARLQRTLLKGVFGADDTSLEDSLSFPLEIISDTSHSVPPIDSQECPGEWFTQEVWTLLGWDTLLECECLEQEKSMRNE